MFCERTNIIIGRWEFVPSAIGAAIRPQPFCAGCYVPSFFKASALLPKRDTIGWGGSDWLHRAY